MKRKFLLISLLLFLGISILYPSPTSAANTAARTGCPTGLVPCGGPGCACQLCDFFVMFKRIIDFLLAPPTFTEPLKGGLVYYLAAIMIAIAGFMYLFAYFGLIGEKGPSLLGKAKSTLTALVIGVIILFGAWLAIGFFFSMIGVAEWTHLTKWYIIDCDAGPVSVTAPTPTPTITPAPTSTPTPTPAVPGSTTDGRLTGYSGAESGGFIDMKGNPLYSLQSYREGYAPYVTVAIPQQLYNNNTFHYGDIVQIPGLNDRSGNPIKFVVADTGSHLTNTYRNSNGQDIIFDICVNPGLENNDEVNKSASIIKTGRTIYDRNP